MNIQSIGSTYVQHCCIWKIQAEDNHFTFIDNIVAIICYLHVT